MICVMDACAMIAYLAAEPGGETVRQILLDDAQPCIAHVVNLCEVYYHFLKRADVASAKFALRTLKHAGVRNRRDINNKFWTGVASLKAECKASLADCFAIELARRANGQVVTSDHHEFDAVAKNGLCRVLFIR